MSQSLYCDNCRRLLGSDKKLTPEEAETVRRCKCLGGQGSDKARKFDNRKVIRRYG